MLTLIMTPAFAMAMSQVYSMTGSASAPAHAGSAPGARAKLRVLVSSLSDSRPAATRQPAKVTPLAGGYEALSEKAPQATFSNELACRTYARGTTAAGQSHAFG